MPHRVRNAGRGITLEVRRDSSFTAGVALDRLVRDAIATEKDMEIRTAKDAEEAYKSFDDWKYADREAAWKWMFEQGQMAEREACAVALEMLGFDEAAAVVRARGNTQRSNAEIRSRTVVRMRISSH